MVKKIGTGRQESGLYMYLHIHVDKKNLRRYECFYGSNTLKQRQVLKRQNNSTPLKYRNFHANNLRLHTS